MDSVERVKNMVRHTLVVKPEVTNRELMARAMEIAPDAVEGLTLRQFHGRFRLPIMRFELGARRRAQKAASGSAATTDNGAASSPTTAGQAKPRSTKAKRTVTPRSKRDATSSAADSAIRKILVEFAVNLEKAESRSELITVVGGVGTFVDRITAVAREYYGSGKRKKPSEN